ncbi:MAG: hypothetical protein ABR529_15930 [Actinomycetota bacterium]
MTLALVVPLLAALAPAAHSQELDIPVMVQTVPELPGARFMLDGTAFTADENGLALVTVDSPGTFDLVAPKGVALADGGRAEFSLWSDGGATRARAVPVESFTLLEAGFDVSYGVTPRLEGPDGAPLPRVASVTFVDDSGETTRWSGTGELRALGQRVVVGGEGLETRSVGHRVESIRGSEATLEAPGETFVSEPAGEWVIEVSSSAPAPDAASEAAPEGSAGEGEGASLLAQAVGAALAALVVALVLLRLGRRTRARPRPASSDAAPSVADERPPLSTAPGGTRLPPAPGRQHLRVRMLSGRVVEGWRNARSARDDERVLMLNVSRVFDPEGEEIPSAPADSFLVTSMIVEVEAVDEDYEPSQEATTIRLDDGDEEPVVASEQAVEPLAVIDLRPESLDVGATPSNGRRP